jgi:hypothetical protein
MVDWNLEARGVLRGELARRDIGYKKLAQLLNGIGVSETQRSITNKLSRGSFSFIFYLQCMTVLSGSVVEIDVRGIVDALQKKQ